MISDLDVAKLVNGIYAYPGDKPVPWDAFDPGDAGPQICWGVRRIGDVSVVVFQGTTNAKGWLRDFDCWADPFAHGTYGRVHPGFLAGMDEAYEAIMSHVHTPQIIVAGHSLGAARADVWYRIFLQDTGQHPSDRVVFGEPKPGFSDFCIPISRGRSYINGDNWGHDLVTDVPFTFWPEQYRRPTSLVPVTASPGFELGDKFGPFCYHHMPLYVSALSKQADKAALSETV